MPGIQEEPNSQFEFPKAQLFNLQLFLTHLNSSELGVDICHVTRMSGWQKSDNEKLIFPAVAWTLSIHNIIFTDSFAVAFTCAQTGHFPDA